MKTKLFIAALFLSGCSAKEYTVLSYNRTSDGMYELEAATRKKDSSFRKSVYFLTECKPPKDSARFMFKKGDQTRTYHERPKVWIIPIQ